MTPHTFFRPACTLRTEVYVLSICNILQLGL